MRPRQRLRVVRGPRWLCQCCPWRLQAVADPWSALAVAPSPADSAGGLCGSSPTQWGPAPPRPGPSPARPSPTPPAAPPELEGTRRLARRFLQDPDTRLSRTLSYALRHGALELGLHMGADGFVALPELLALPSLAGVSEGDVRRVVETNEKQRFALRPAPSGGLQIRANQGHSLEVPELELTPLETPESLPPTLAHGTQRRLWDSIRRGGLSRRGRTHIHLAPGLPGDAGVLSGMRPDSEVAVIIDGPQALADGIRFFRAANGVVLTPGDAHGVLPPRYILCALQLRPSRCLLPLD